MADHIQLGKEGEALAARWLTDRGYRILHQNWRYSYHEIDIIATRGQFLHFVEIKTRRESQHSFPEDSVSRKKFRSLKRAADEFLFRHPGHPWIQYDVLAITLLFSGDAEYFLIEDVYYND